MSCGCKDKDRYSVAPKWDELARLFIMAAGGWTLLIGAIWLIAQIL